jgi:hypothetical protein
VHLLQALELAAASQASLDAITRLTTSALETLENIDKKFETTVNAIKLAASSKMITVEEALGLWKIARRVRLTNERRALLINLPCSYVSNVEIGSETSPATTVLRSKHAFEVQGQLPSELSARCALFCQFLPFNPSPFTCSRCFLGSFPSAFCLLNLLLSCFVGIPCRTSHPLDQSVFVFCLQREDCKSYLACYNSVALQACICISTAAVLRVQCSVRFISCSYRFL